MLVRHREFPDKLTLRWDHIGLYRALIQWLVSAQEGELDTQKGHHVNATVDTRVKDRQGFLASTRSWEKQGVNLPWAFRGSLALQMLQHHIWLLKSPSWWQFLKVYYQIVIIHNSGFHDYMYTMYSGQIHSLLPSLVLLPDPNFCLWGYFSTNKHYKGIT